MLVSATLVLIRFLNNMLSSILAIIAKAFEFTTQLFVSKNSQPMVNNANQQEKADQNADAVKTVQDKDVDKTRTDLTV